MGNVVTFDIKLILDRSKTDLSKNFMSQQANGLALKPLFTINAVRKHKSNTYWYDTSNRSLILKPSDNEDIYLAVIRCRVYEPEGIKTILTQVTNDGSVIAKEGEFLGTAIEDGALLPEMYLYPDVWVSPKMLN